MVVIGKLLHHDGYFFYKFLDVFEAASELCFYSEGMGRKFSY